MARIQIIILSIALLFLCSKGWAQNVNRNEILREMGKPVLFGEIFNQKLQVHGTPFFIEEWSRGDIYLVNDVIASGEMLKYNGLTNKLHWFDSSRNTTIILDKAPITGFSMEDPHSNEQLIFRKSEQDFSIDGEGGGIFLQLLYEGDFSLYVHRKVIERSRRVVYQNDQRVELPVLEAQPVYYVDVAGGELVQIRRMRKSFLYDLATGYEDAIRQALADHPSRLRSERMLIAAIKAINKL